MLTIIPAYGRDYKSGKAAREDWQAGKDFKICDMSSKFDGSSINLADALRDGTIKQVKIRYKKNTQLVVVDVKAQKAAPIVEKRRAHVVDTEQEQRVTSARNL